MLGPGYSLLDRTIDTLSMIGHSEDLGALAMNKCLQIFNRMSMDYDNSVEMYQ